MIPKSCFDARVARRGFVSAFVVLRAQAPWRIQPSLANAIRTGRCVEARGAEGESLVVRADRSLVEARRPLGVYFAYDVFGPCVHAYKKGSSVLFPIDFGPACVFDELYGSFYDSFMTANTNPCMKRTIRKWQYLFIDIL